jgi:hypothetical protein
VRVGIVAKAATAALAPYDDPSWNLWGLAWVGYPRINRLFDIHDVDFKIDTPTDFNSQRNAEYVERVEERHPDAPVWSLPGAPFLNRVDYPLKAVVADLGRAYFECTVAYMIALAIHEKAERIGLWGCHFTGRTEFQWQRPSVTWLIGLAEGRGIPVEVCPGTPLMVSCYTQGRYGITPELRGLA